MDPTLSSNIFKVDSKRSSYDKHDGNQSDYDIKEIMAHIKTEHVLRIEEKKNLKRKLEEKKWVKLQNQLKKELDKQSKGRKQGLEQKIDDLIKEVEHDKSLVDKFGDLLYHSKVNEKERLNHYKATHHKKLTKEIQESISRLTFPKCGLTKSNEANFFTRPPEGVYNSMAMSRRYHDFLRIMTKNNNKTHISTGNSTNQTETKQNMKSIKIMKMNQANTNVDTENQKVLCSGKQLNQAMQESIPKTHEPDAMERYLKKNCDFFSDDYIAKYKRFSIFQSVTNRDSSKSSNHKENSDAKSKKKLTIES